MKKTILAIFLLFCISSMTYSQEFAADNYKLPALFLPDTEMFLLTQTAYSVDYSSTFGGKLGYGLLNVFFGLGSYLAGDWGWGIGLTLWQGLGFAGFLGFGLRDLAAGTFFDGYGERWIQAGAGALAGLVTGALSCVAVAYYYPGTDFTTLMWTTIGFTLIGGVVGFIINPEGVNYTDPDNMGLAMASFGIWVTGVIFGIILPYLPTPHQVKTARLDDLRNWTIGLAPASDRHLTGQIAFTAYF